MPPIENEEKGNGEESLQGEKSKTQGGQLFKADEKKKYRKTTQLEKGQGIDITQRGRTITTYEFTPK